MMSCELAADGWIVSVECPATGPARYLAGFYTPREALMAIRQRHTARPVRLVACTRLTQEDLVAARLIEGEVRPVHPARDSQ
jgi:hypothetical protein